MLLFFIGILKYTKVLTSDLFCD